MFNLFDALETETILEPDFEDFESYLSFHAEISLNKQYEYDQQEARNAIDSHEYDMKRLYREMKIKNRSQPTRQFSW